MSAVGLIGLGVSAVGAGISFFSHQDTVTKQTNLSKQAENIKAQQMELDSLQRKRQAVRGSLMARAVAVSNGVAQGAGTKSSGVLGGAGGATAEGLESQKVTNASTILGQRAFKNNADYFKVTQDGQFWESIGNGISSIGNVVAGNAGTITSLGMDWFSPRTPGYNGSMGSSRSVAATGLSYATGATGW